MPSRWEVNFMATSCQFIWISCQRMKLQSIQSPFGHKFQVIRPKVCSNTCQHKVASHRGKVLQHKVASHRDKVLQHRVPTYSSQCTDVCMYIYIYIYIDIERDRNREREIYIYIGIFICLSILYVDWTRYRHGCGTITTQVLNPTNSASFPAYKRLSGKGLVGWYVTEDLSNYTVDKYKYIYIRIIYI